jgi:lipopolysaccharide export system permease protein
VKIFWKSQPDTEVEQISEKLESIIEQLSNSRNRIIIGELNEMPVLISSAHTSPFLTKWKNVVAGIFFPLGAFFYFRIWRYRIRLLNDMRKIIQCSDTIQEQITLITAKTA